jgi:DNA polymerase-1
VNAVIIDMNNLLYASAFNPHKHYTQAGLPRYLLRGAISRVTNLRKQYPSADFYVVWDAEDEYWRSDVFAGYKQKVEDKAKELAKADCQLARPALRDLFERMGIPQLHADRHEADDVFPVLIKALVAGMPEIKIHLISSDKDAYQLISKNVSCVQVLEPNATITLENYFEMTGYKSPAQFKQAKWLVDDSNDALSGVMSKKEAQLLLSKCDDILHAIDHPELDIPEVSHLLKVIRQPKKIETIYRNRQLMLLDGHSLTTESVKCIAPQEPCEYICNKLAKSLGISVPKIWFNTAS